jgi:hypothetical protein
MLQSPMRLHVPPAQLPAIRRLALRRQRRVPLRSRGRQHHLRTPALRQPRHWPRRLHPRRPGRGRVLGHLGHLLLWREVEGQEQICSEMRTITG